MRTVPWLLLLALALPLSGCLDDPGGLSDGTDTDTMTAAPQPHGTPDRTDGAVHTEQRDGRWRASREVVITNGIGDADAASVDQETFNGVLTTSGSDDGGYTLTATLYAYGDTEQTARDMLDRLDVVHTDTLQAGTLALTTSYEIDSVPALPLLGGAQYEGGMDLELALDARPALGYNGHTTNGPITVAGLSGPSVSAETTNGPVTVQGGFDTLDLHATNGPITGRLDRWSQGEGSYQAETTNGPVTLVVATGEDRGFDASGHTTNGFVTFNLPDTENVGSQSGTDQHVRTRDYEDHVYRTQMDLRSTNGNVVATG